MEDFCDRDEAAKILGCHVDSLKRYRESGKLQENIHYIRISSRKIRYIKPLLIDLINNWNNPQGHQRAIENYNAQKLSNQRKKR